MPFEHPNALYFIALFIWPFVAYKIYKRYDLEKAVILLFLVPYLFLPVPLAAITPLKVPLLPPIDKEAVPVFTALWLIYKNKIKVQYLPRFGISVLFCVAFLTSPFITIFTNFDPIVFPTRVLPGQKVSEALSMFVALYIKVYVPFVVGFSLLSSNKAHENFIVLLVALGLIYSIFMLYEVRMSPQLHRKVYGYFPHSWIQQVRDGGFRPVVFLGHGLLVAVYGCMAASAAFVLWRMRHPFLRGKGGLCVLYFCVLLILCKTYSALIYFLLFVLLWVFFGPRMRLKAVSVVALIVLLYPAIRGALPLADVTEFFMSLNPERARSLQFRFLNEDMLLDRANERPLFGWGTWGRNRVYDPATGEDLSVTDGSWIITFGAFGWFGYLATLGLLGYPAIAIARACNRKNEVDLSMYTLGLSLILMMYLIDQIPNASLNHLSYLIAGAILGRAKELAAYKPPKTTAENPASA